MIQIFFTLIWLATAQEVPPTSSPPPPSTTSGSPIPASIPPSKPSSVSSTPATEPITSGAPTDADQRMDQALERFHTKKMLEGAGIVYELYTALPETDLRRDTAAFHLAGALVNQGFIQAGIEYYLEILAGRRSPELLGKTLTALKPLYERGLLEEWRFLDCTIYGTQYGDLEPEVRDFVDYLQALGDLRLGFTTWGRSRLETLAATDRHYGWRARYLLATERIAQHNDDGAEKLLRQILDKGPDDIRTLAALALARILYEQKRFDEAFSYYSQVKLPLVEQDMVLLERAWDRIGADDHQRALGMVVGLGAPIFRRVFAPERELIRALALRRLCQYGLAHQVVREFHEHYGTLVRKARDRDGLKDDPQIVEWAGWGTRLASFARTRTRLRTETALIRRVANDALEAHLQALYGARLAFTEDSLRRGLGPAIEQVVNELLRVDEQMNLIDYEIGAGLVKPGSKRGAARILARPGDLPAGSPQVFFPFNGEYWSDELNDFAVLADDRCLR
jgi:tetratricopeptide (TPR) repeat protein